jgi:acyl carrier protein
MTHQIADVVSVVGQFVARTRGVPADSVDESTPLFAEGLLDSFSLVELTTELESALGIRIGDGLLLPEDFETPARLFERLGQL